MRRRRHQLTWAFAGVWLTLAGFTAWLHVRGVGEADDALPPETPIGVLSKKQGEVEYRRDELLLWSPSREKQTFGEGDLVATGEGSHATLTLGDGRRLELGENSLVRLAKEGPAEKGQASGGGGGGYVVTLVSGTLTVKEAASPKTSNKKDKVKAPIIGTDASVSLTILAGTKVLALTSPDASLTLEKIGEAPVTVKAKAGSVKVREAPPKAVAGEADRGPGKVAAPPGGLPFAAAAPTPLVPPPDATGLEPRLHGPHAGGELWTESALTAAGLELTFELTPAARLPSDALWQPLLKVVDISGGPVLTLAGAGGKGAEALTMKLRDLQGGHGDEGMRRLMLRPGARVSRGTLSSESFVSEGVTLTLRSFATLSPAPLTLEFSTPGRRRRAEAWLQASSFGRGGEHLFVHLHDGRDLPRLLPLIREGRLFGVLPYGAKDAETRLQVVRDGVVASTLTGLLATAATGRGIMTLLGGDEVFHGPAAALLLARRSGERLSPAAIAGLTATGSLYVQSTYFGERSYGLAPEFHREGARIASYLARSAWAIFREPVEIVTPPSRTTEPRPQKDAPLAH